MFNIPMGNYTMELGQIIKHGGKIFDFNYPFYSEEHREEFERKFLLHFRYNEIGQETLQRFKYMLQDVLTTNAPKYEHYYKTWLVAKDLNWQYNKDYTEENKRVLDSIDNSNSKNVSKYDGESGSFQTTIDVSKNTSKFSDTPQGKIENLEENNYLTNATIDDYQDDTTNQINSSDSSDSSSENTASRTGKDTETILNKQYGNIGVTSSGDLVDSWNKTAIWFNIDKIIFDDCEELFMGIY